ncbi:lipoprotein LpqH [Nocardia blacklockiae]|uniref:lipoprotein LpqH n=1 Tax=Nocardia blacklockiae TaxID=480036 RepID=UPI00189503C0|nr:lipoprotein LpqH [Nocardia blacklockiae]MBF6171921.1 lipoprotein LpqH [Nocardia blacklockiae]
MNSKQIRRTAAALAVAGLSVFAAACGDDSPTAAPSPTQATAAPTQAAGGRSAALVDGKALDGKFETTCAKQGGVLALALTDIDNATYGRLSVSATLTDDHTVQAVGIAGSKGGSSGMPYAVGYGNGQPGGSATVVKDGNTYKVTGEGVAAPDMSNPLAAPATAKFDLTFACTTVVNG